jgi:hypothetical protein
VTRASDTVGRAAIANKSAILLQASSIELLLRGLIDREKETRSNSGSLPELEALLTEVGNLRASLATATAAPEVGALALSFKAGVLAWWAKDHVSIVDNCFKSSLFVLLMGLIVHFGLIPATIAATLLNKDVGEALKELAKLLKLLKGGCLPKSEFAQPLNRRWPP